MIPAQKRTKQIASVIMVVRMNLILMAVEDIPRRSYRGIKVKSVRGSVITLIAATPNKINEILFFFMMIYLSYNIHYGLIFFLFKDF